MGKIMDSECFGSYEDRTVNTGRQELEMPLGDVREGTCLAVLQILSDGIWVLESDGEVIYRNPSAAAMEKLYWSRSGIVGTIDDVVFNEETFAHIQQQREDFREYHLSGEDDMEAEVYSIGMELRLLKEVEGRPQFLFHARDVSREWWREQSLQDRHIELENAYKQLKVTQTQLLQSEKMASIGQLAAGVAHEINNPIGYVHSNLGTLQTYTNGLISLIDAYEKLSLSLPENLRSLSATADETAQRVDYSFLRQDLPELLRESREGIERVKKIVLDLRDFSRSGQSDVEEWVRFDLHKGLESTLNIVWSELKYKATVTRRFGQIPVVECMPSQLNQVFLNLLVNAGQAIAEQGEINISTRYEGNEVCVSISDTGSGIAEADLPRIFDPFFTTKAVGQGTGLGLALSYSIIRKHHGRIEVSSVKGMGTTFSVYLPAAQLPPGGSSRPVAQE